MTALRPWQHPDPERTTIAALATPPGISAVAVVRISGTGCHQLIPKLFAGLDSPEPWRLYRRTLVLSPDSQAEQPVSDDVLVVVFKAPKSFTGQDALEIHSHGSPFILSRLLATLISLGVRAAEPGQFTRRALLAGKMDLSQAEGLKDLIHAQSAAQWQAARYLATGSLQVTIDRLRGQLIEAMAYLEAMIDFPDEGDTAAVHLGEVIRRVQALTAELKGLKESYRSGRVAREGLKVVIAGFPNQGKSTLLNQLIQKNRAIVSATAGTTRDYLEEPCLIAGRLIRLFDTAGIRVSADPIEQQGVALAEELIREADLALIVIAADEPDPAAMIARFAAMALPRQLYVLNKTDAASPEQVAALKEQLAAQPSAQPPGQPFNHKSAVAISCQSGAGMAELYEAIGAAVDENLSALSRDDFLANARHYAAVETALGHIAAFEAALAQGMYEECLAFELSEVSRALGSIVGAVDHEDILDKVFADFCIGK